MNSISLTKTITDKGIFINPEILSDFQNSKVEITITKKNVDDKKASIMKFAGILDSDEADTLTKSINECRRVDTDAWR